MLKRLKYWWKRRTIYSDRNATRSKEHMSPSGRWRLVETHHTTGAGTWAYTKGKLYDSRGKLISEVRRNYSQFPFSWVEDHPNGHDYLICGEDYQGQTVVELDTGERRSYLPDAAKKGFGFCWASHHPSPDGTMVAVCGCFWGGPYEVLIIDFSDPLNMPWTELMNDQKNDDFFGWNEDGSCSIGREWEVVNLPGHPLDGKSENEITMADLKEMDKIEGYHWKAVKDTITWDVSMALKNRPNVIRYQELTRELLELRDQGSDEDDHLNAMDDVWETLTEDEIDYINEN